MLLRKVHDVCWGLWIFCVVVYYISYFWDFAQRFLCLSLLIGPHVRTPPQPPSTPVVQNIAEIPEPTRSFKPLNPELKLLFIQQGKGSRSKQSASKPTLQVAHRSDGLIFSGAPKNN